MTNWSPRDVVAHLVGWNGLMIEASASILSGQQLSYYADAPNDYSNINAGFTARYSSGSKQELLKELRSSLESLEAYVIALPAEELTSDHGVQHYSGRSATVSKVIESLADDYRYHTNEIREWLNTKMIEPNTTDKPSELSWVARLPLTRDPVFVRQMSLVFLIPLVVLGLIMIVIEWPLDTQRLGMVAKVVLITGSVMLSLYLFVIFGVLRGRQEIRYTLDAKSAREETAGPLKYMNIVKLLLVLSGKPTFASIGLMAQGPKSERITWKRVEKVVSDQRTKTITLRKGRTDLMVLHCEDTNFDQVLAWVQANVGK
jgi:hypothetical protein